MKRSTCRLIPQHPDGLLASSNWDEIAVDEAEAAAHAEAEAAMPPHGVHTKVRLEHLFRHGARQGVINPLFYVLTRYRLKEEK